MKINKSAALLLSGFLALNPINAKATTSAIDRTNLSTSVDESNQGSENDNQDKEVDIFGENFGEEVYDDFPYSYEYLNSYSVYYKLHYIKEDMDFLKESFGSISQARRSQGIEVDDETARIIDETSDYIYQCIDKYLNAFDSNDNETCYNTIRELLESYASFRLYSIFTINDNPDLIIDYYNGVFSVYDKKTNNYRLINIIEICDTLPLEALDLEWIRLAQIHSLDEYAPIYKDASTTTLTNKTVLEHWYKKMKELEEKEHIGDDSYLYQQVKYSAAGNKKQNSSPVYKKTRYKPDSSPKGQRARYNRY